MQAGGESAAAPAAPRGALSRRIAAPLERLAAHVATASGAMFLLLALFMTGEAISRSLGGPLTGLGDQVASLVLSLAGSWALAHGVATGSHVRIDVLMPLIPRAATRWLDALSMSALAAFACILAYNCWKVAWASHQLGALIPQSNLELPLALPQALTAGGLTLLALMALVRVPLQMAGEERASNE